MSDTKSATRTKAPWAWMNDSTLVGAHGHRPVVLMPRPKNKLGQRGPEGLMVDADRHHPDMLAIAGSARLIEAVEGFLKLRTSIFPSVSGAPECAALEELEEALKAAGGEVPYA